MYIGCYTSQDGGGDGIALAELDSGIPAKARTVAEVSDPSFLVRSADRRFVYATLELTGGRVAAFEVAPDGTLTALGEQPTEGAHPCHLTIDPSGRYLLSANYTSGSVAVHPIGADGSLGELTQLLQRSGSGPVADRQEGPHAHQVVFDPAGEYVFDVDLGTDTVHTSVLAEDGRLEARGELSIRPGAGPRHLAFHPGGATAYLINELDSTLDVCAYSGGELSVVQTVSTRPEDASGENFPAEVLVSADGAFVYGSNRGDDTIAVFSTADDGRRVELTRTIGSGGSWPRHLALSGSLLYAANERSDAVATFAVGSTLEPVGTPLSWPKPVCLLPA
jgi:6-phosphogluconolactonase